MKEKLVIIGAGGHGKVLADIATSMNKYNEILFIDDFADKDACAGHRIIGRSDSVNEHLGKAEFIVAIGNNKIRMEKQNELEKINATISTLVHPSAIIGKNVEIGAGTVIMPGVIINTEAKIGKGCIINTSSSVDHECNIEDFTHISVGSHIAGQVEIGKTTMVGAGATVINNIRICEGCTIGAGTVVINDINEKGIYIGVPAKEVKRV